MIPDVSQSDLHLVLDGRAPDQVVAVQVHVDVDLGDEPFEQADAQVVEILHGQGVLLAGAPEHAGLGREEIARPQGPLELGVQLQSRDVPRPRPFPFDGQPDADVGVFGHFLLQPALDPENERMYLTRCPRPDRVRIEPQERREIRIRG